VPPQSTSVSLPFCTVSPQVGRAQVPSVLPSAPLQILFSQSVPTRQSFSSRQGLQPGPPQSTSVSVESLTSSVQCAATHMPLPSQTSPDPPSGKVQAVPLVTLVLLHTFALQAKVRQVVEVPQSLATLHATQLPLPSQTLSPVPPLQVVPAVALDDSQQPLVLHVPTTQALDPAHVEFEVHAVPPSAQVAVTLVLVLVLVLGLLVVVMPPVPPSAPPALIWLRSTEAMSSQPLDEASATARPLRKIPVRSVVVLVIARTS
jgi:hypothetical protein